MFQRGQVRKIIISKFGNTLIKVPNVSPLNAEYSWPRYLVTEINATYLVRVKCCFVARSSFCEKTKRRYLEKS